MQLDGCEPVMSMPSHGSVVVRSSCTCCTITSGSLLIQSVCFICHSRQFAARADWGRWRDDKRGRIRCHHDLLPMGLGVGRATTAISGWILRLIETDKILNHGETDQKVIPQGSLAVDLLLAGSSFSWRSKLLLLLGYLLMLSRLWNN